MVTDHRGLPKSNGHKSRVVWVQASLYTWLKKLAAEGDMKEDDRILCLYVDEPGLLTLMEFLPGDTLAEQLAKK